MDQGASKQMTIHEALHQKDDIDYMYLEKKDKVNPSILKIVSMNQYKDLKTT